MARFVRSNRICQLRLGTCKLHFLLRHQAGTGLQIGRDRLFRMLTEHRLLLLPKRTYHKITYSYHHFYLHPNLLKAAPQQTLPIRSEWLTSPICQAKAGICS